MNTNPIAKTILCYGDSNTWGQKPDKSVGSRLTSVGQGCSKKH